MTATHRWAVTWVTGPDAGQTTCLGVGEHLVGRAPQAHVRCDDPELEPFHAQLCLADGWEIHQLAGRIPLDIGSEEVRIGASTLRITSTTQPVEPAAAQLVDADAAEPAGCAAAHPAGCAAAELADSVAGRALTPAPRPTPAFDPLALGPRPEPEPSSIGSARLTGVATGVVAAAASLVSAAVTRQVVVAVFALVGLLVAVPAAALGWRAERHRRCAAQVAHDDAVARWLGERALQRAAWVAEQWARTATLPDVLAALGSQPPGPWPHREYSRQRHGSPAVVAVGIGSLPWQPVAVGADPAERLDAAAAELVPGLPVAVDLAPGTVLALRGPHAVGLARSLVVQLACQFGPTGWHLQLELGTATTTSTHHDWAWATTLTHPRPRGATGAAPVDPLPGPGVEPAQWVIVTDRVDELAVADGPLRRALTDGHRPTVIVVDPTSSVLPAACTAVVDTTVDGRGRARLDLTSGSPPIDLRVSALGRHGAVRAATALAAPSSPAAPSTPPAPPTRLNPIEPALSSPPLGVS